MNKKKSFSVMAIQLVLPIAFQQFMLSLVSATDAVMLGRISQELLSSASLAGQITFVYNLFLAAMTIGTSIFAAQYYGKSDMISVEKILAIVLRISFVVSAGFFAATIFVPVQLMRIFTLDEILIQSGVVYLRIVGISYLMCGVSQIYLCIMKNSGRAIQSMAISSATVMINIILNAVLIFGLLGFPEMGIAGAALATTISRFMEVLCVFLENRKTKNAKIKWHYMMHVDKELKEDFWKYTLPVLGNEMVWGCGFTMYSVIMGHLGSDVVAANSIANIVKNLAVCFCIGLGNGGGIIVGNELGAGNLEQAKTYGKKFCHLAVIAGAASGVLMLAVLPFVLQITELTVQAQYYLKWMFVMCFFNMFGKSVNSTTISGIFCAGGDSRFGFWCDAITMWCVTVPLGLIAAFVLKLPVVAVYCIVNMDELVKLPAVYLRFVKYRWVRNLTRTE